MSSLFIIPRSRISTLVAALFIAITPLSRAASDIPTLVVTEEPGVITVSFSGKPAALNFPGIPSWKAIMRKNDGGNISALHVPADSPLDVSSRRGGWPITIISTRSMAGVNDPDKGRDNYASFEVRTLEVTSRSPEQVVVKVAGPSKRKHYDHERTYTFTARGVAIQGSVTARVDLKRVSWDPHWDREQVADSHFAAIPLRTQGRHGWIPALSSGSDAVTPLPEFVNFPLEAEMKLRRDAPTFIRIFIDQHFKTSNAQRMMVNNNKDFTSLHNGKTYHEKLVGGIESGPLLKGQSDTFKVRYEFESRVNL